MHPTLFDIKILHPAASASMIDKPKFQIVYKKTENGGKHRAVNAAVKLACGEFIFIVDSDDILTNDAVEKGDHNR